MQNEVKQNQAESGAMPDHQSPRLFASRPRLKERLLLNIGGQMDRVLVSAMNRIFESNREVGHEEFLTDKVARARAFYCDPRFRSDPNTFHVPPVPHGYRSQAHRKIPGGTLVETIFESHFVPRNPYYRETYFRFKENRKIHLFQFKHRERRPTVLYVHGWCGGYPELEYRMFSLNAIYEKGYDVAFFTLPFHGARTPKQGWFGGYLFPCPRLERTNEGFAHAIHDLRVVADFVTKRGRAPLGLFGVSLGAYVATLALGLGLDVKFFVAMIPLADLPEFMWRHGQGNPEMERARRLGIDKEFLREAYAVHAPLRFPSPLKPEQTLIIAGRGDGACTFDQTEALWHHLGRPEVFWFPGGHVLYFGQAGIAKRLADFVHQGFNSIEVSF